MTDNNTIKNLYIHIPFCSKICTYCDFYKMVASKEKQAEYIDYLIKELEQKKNYLNNLETIFIGGGTPTALGTDLFEVLLKYLNAYIKPNILKEFTIEANPNDISADMAHLFKKYQVNRVSLGIQGLKQTKLDILGRTHTEEDVIKAIKNLRDANITNISADLIYGVGDEVFSDIKYDIKILIKNKIKHFSIYSLILEDKTILMKLYKEGKFELYDDDAESKLYADIIKYLKSKNFKHYEISNFTKRGYESLHNLVYWNNEFYMGAGASSTYYYDHTRFTNIKNLKKYYQGIDNNDLIYENKSFIPKEEMMKEELIMGLRKLEGIDLTNFQNKFQITIEKAFPIIHKLLNFKLLKIKKNRIFIPEKKLYLSNEILVNFI